MFNLSDSHSFGSADPSAATVVSESGENATHSKTIYLKHQKEILGLSYFTDLDMDPRDRPFLPLTKAGCEQIARSLEKE